MLAELATGAWAPALLAAFGLDEGESIGGLLEQGPPTPGVAHVDVDALEADGHGSEQAA